MKHLIFLLGILFLTLVQPPQAAAQSNGYSLYSNQTAVGSSRDTLINQDTLIVPLELNAISIYKIDAIIRADSISGANAGTVALQFAHFPTRTKPTASSPVQWITVASATIDGPGTTLYRLTSDQTARMARLFITTPSGTRRTELIYNVGTKIVR